MLWSVVVCDIVYKLQHLVDLYKDASASEILSELTAIQNNDPKSSAWEFKLIECVYEKTDLIDNAELENLRYLQKQRHLSAHPVLKRNFELYFPNKETTRAILRNTLEGVLIKPPFYTQKILNELLSDISENTAALNTRKKVKQYVESRYLNRMTQEVELQIYRSLWKLVFKLDDEDCKNNRNINLKVLDVIGSRNVAQLEAAISGELDYYSSVASEGNAIEYLVFYLSKNSRLYNLLTEDAKLKVIHCVETDYIGKTLGWFVKENLEQHYNDVLAWIEGEEHPNFEEGQWEALLEISDSEEWQEMFCKLVGAYYAMSYTYDQADSRFKSSVQLYLPLFNVAAIHFMLQKIEINNQTYRRSLSSFDHPKIKRRAVEFDENFDFAPYPCFSQSVAED